MGLFDRFRAKRVPKGLLSEYSDTLRGYTATVADLDALNHRIKVLCTDPAYKELLDLLKEKEEFRKIALNAERKLHDTQSKIARELGILPERIYDYTINTKTGVVTLKGDMNGAS